MPASQTDRAMDAEYLRNSERHQKELNAEGGMAFDGRPEDMVDWEYEASLPTWRRLWRAKWNLKPRGPMWLPQIIRMTWCAPQKLRHSG